MVDVKCAGVVVVVIVIVKDYVYLSFRTADLKDMLSYNNSLVVDLFNFSSYVLHIQNELLSFRFLSASTH